MSIYTTKHWKQALYVKERCRNVSYIPFVSQTYPNLHKPILRRFFSSAGVEVYSFLLYSFKYKVMGGVTVVNVSNYTRYIFYSKFTEKSKVICLALSLSRRPLNVLHDHSFYASLPILTGKKCYFCGFNCIVILEIVWAFNLYSSLH